MNQARQRAYLEALDIPVWIRKDLANEAPGFVPAGLKLGPGSGQLLLVCAGQEEQTTRISSDIARSLGAEPVWAWPDPGEGGSDISETVREHLFTSIVLFGNDLAGRLFGTVVPETLGSARLISAPGMEELAKSPDARRALWQLICANQLAQRPRA